VAGSKEITAALAVINGSVAVTIVPAVPGDPATSPQTEFLVE